MQGAGFLKTRLKYDSAIHVHEEDEFMAELFYLFIFFHDFLSEAEQTGLSHRWSAN